MTLPSPSLLAAIRRALAGHPGVSLALLFGSSARGADRRGSDLDLAVSGEGLDRLAIAASVEEATGVDVDVVDLGAAGYPLLQALLRDGIVVHEGERHAAARWRTSAIL